MGTEKQLNKIHIEFLVLSSVVSNQIFQDDESVEFTGSEMTGPVVGNGWQ